MICLVLAPKLTLYFVTNEEMAGYQEIVAKFGSTLDIMTLRYVDLAFDTLVSNATF